MFGSAIFRACSLGLFLGLLGMTWLYLDVHTLLDEEWMDAHVRSAGILGVGIYVCLVTCLTAMGVPRQACSLFGGYVFGMWYGTLWATLGTVFACLLCFSYARFLGQNWLQKRYAHKLHNFNDFICQSPFLLTLVVRIVPLGSNFLTNFLAGMSPIPAKAFLGGSAVGFTVQNFIFATMGSGFRMQGGQEFYISAALYVISLSMGYLVYKRYKAHQNTCIHSKKI